MLSSKLDEAPSIRLDEAFVRAEGRRMAKFWSDGQKSYIRLAMLAGVRYSSQES